MNIRQRLIASLRLLPVLALAACTATPTTQRPGTGSLPRPATPPAAAAPAAPVDPAVAEEARKQSDLAFRQEVSEISRLYALFWPLARAAAPICESRSIASIGPWPGTLLAVGESARPGLRRLLGMDERLTFVVVVDNTPAARAGVRAGDILLAMDNQPVAASKEAGRQYNQLLAAAATRGTPVELLLERKGAQLRVAVPVEQTCAASIRVLTSDVVSAYASGRVIGVTRGMLRFADDRELAIVIGHELAHVALGHTLAAAPPPAAQSNVPAVGAGIGASGTNGGTMPGTTPAAATAPRPASPPTPEQRAQSQQRELDADVAGLALVAAAGMPIHDAAQFWRRMAAAYPATIQHSPLRTHPASPERFVEIERATRDLEGKLSRRVPLTAQSKDGRMLASLTPSSPAGPWTVNWLNDSLRSPQVLASDQVPFVRDDGREAYRAFLEKASPRAFALSENGNWASAWGVDDPASRALARCAEKGGRNCRLYAVDSRVVWEGSPSPAVNASAGGVQ